MEPVQRMTVDEAYNLATPHYLIPLGTYCDKCSEPWRCKTRRLIHDYAAMSARMALLEKVLEAARVLFTEELQFIAPKRDRAPYWTKRLLELRDALASLPPRDER